MAVITYRQALNDTLAEELARDSAVVLMGEEIGKFGGSYKITAGLLDRFGPTRVVDMPISEMGFVGLAAGAAMLGVRPVVEIMTINFILMAVDQIVNHASKVHYMFGGQATVPLVIRTPSGGIGQLAATHSQSFENWFAYCPGLKVVAPSTPYDAKGLLRAAIRDDDPVIFIESLPLYDTKGEVPEGDFTVPIGVADVKREGTHVTVIAYSRTTVMAMQVADQLQRDEGISVEVVDLRSLRPLDRPTIVESVRKTSRAVIVEEDWRSYGIGAEIAATIQEEAFDYLDAPVLRVAGLEVPLPYSEQLSRASKPVASDLVAAIHAVLKGSVMRSEITMPRLSDTMSEGTVDRWLKQPGDPVERDEVIAEIQTDKATMELVAFEHGILDEIVVPNGGNVPIGQVIGWIRGVDDPASSAPSAPPAPPASPASSAAPAAGREPAAKVSGPAPAPAPVSTNAPAAVPTGPPATGDASHTSRIKASPLARQVAKAHNVDLGAVQGTGPGGRILRENVEQFREHEPPARREVPARQEAPDTIVPMTRIHRATARAVSESKPGIPHIYLTVDIDMDAAMALRQQINDSGAVDVKITPNDLVVVAAARALIAHPEINSRYATLADGEPGLVRQTQINVSVAVATERGLLAPVVLDADKKSFAAVAAEIRELAGRARDGKSRQRDLEGATFQTSNLGMFGVRDFVSIITSPQAASLAIGAVREAPVVRDGQLRVGQVMSVTLSVDHRVADGAAAARYLQELTRRLTSPLSLLL